MSRATALGGDGASPAKPSWATALLWIAAIIALQVGSLWALGRVVIAESGTIELWHGASDAGQSQHLTDWYTFTHFEHGLIFYLVLTALFPRLSLAGRLAAAVLIEGGWEIVENTNFIIDRYRESNVAHGYRGDSIVNSLGDMAAMILGFLAASRLGTWRSIVLIAAIEIFLLLSIRDNLALSALSLVHRFEAIEAWQAGAGRGP